MPERQLAVIDVKPGIALESQSGLQTARPRIYGAFEGGTRRGDGPSSTAAIVMHPTSNFMGHYLITPLAERGITCMGLNSRYVGNDATLIMERVIQDLGAGVRFLRERGHERVILIGNSGGAALVSFYQAQAENLTVQATPAGDPVDLAEDDLPPVDGIVLNAAHAGRSRLFADWADPSVIDESDAMASDPALDMFNPENGPPYAHDFLERYRAAQRQRQARIEAWARARLRFLRGQPDGPQDQAFVVYRTSADPRFLDQSIDPNDRGPGAVAGDPRVINYAGNALGRYTSLTAFLSQWAQCSQADGPTNLAKTTIPVLFQDYTADESTYPSTAKLWLDAAGSRGRKVEVKGGTHYLKDQPELVSLVADTIADFCAKV